MGLSLYNFSVKSYSALVRLISPFNKKARQFTAGRKDIFNKLDEAFQNNEAPVFWLHAASLGEFEQGRPVMEAYRKHFPGHRILLTFYSPSGYEIRKNYDGADDVFYLPEDSRSNADRFYEIVRPLVGVIVKYEFWYHYIDRAQTHNVRLISISTILRHGHFLLKMKGKFLADRIKAFDHFFTQDHNTGQLLKQIGIEKITVAGDTRYDRVAEIAASAANIDLIERFISGSQAMVIGSSWSSDLEKLYPVINTFSDRMKFIVAPHNIKESEIASIEGSTDVNTIRFSLAGDEENLTDYDMMIIDNIGMLSSLYRYGRYAYVGGAFRGALHNILEPAVYGIPVFYGKHGNNEKFLESRDLIRTGGAFEIETSGQLISLLEEMEKEPRVRQNAGQACARWVENSRGATKKIMNYLIENIHE